ncbi:MULTISPECIES: CHAT domain-containing protein [unclassified Coleofasciculus]|uniref:CHAT domain-containing protein n=1 Tax=unclassified Coleofasciculus TaxID=2692782 RepID=UPI00188238FB|nr:MULTISPECIES: tetratricopeptide repeat protein [unclassified Coleofasciculus]MBE9128447.1 tetratricopeptide repeat protein [Coleofasciculus sp. LEGE 07081]MBE9149396.1 tetratricopeptide repeat protein [Coleofasciculus sp. LEGE 07092]
MQLRSRLFGIITLLAATGGVFTASFAAPFSVLPVMAQTSTEQEAEADQLFQEAGRLFQQGIEQYKTSQFQAAIQSWQQALDIYLEIGNNSGIANSSGSLGVVYLSLGQYEKAIEFFQIALVIQQEIDDRVAVAASFANLGNAYYFLGQYQKAIEFHQQSLAIKREIDDSPNGNSFASRAAVANSLSNLGVVYEALGQYQKAIEFHQQSLAIQQEIGDRSGIAASFANLGTAYASLGQYQKTIEFFQQSLVIAQEIDSPETEAILLGNLGNVYGSLGQYQKAIEFHQQSLEIKREIGVRSGVASSLANLGNAYAFLGQYQKAIEFFQQSLAIAQEIDSREIEGKVLGNLGNVYDDLEQYQKAIEFHQQSLAISQEIGDRSGVAYSLATLGNVYASLGQYQKAMEFHQQSLAITQEIGDRALEGLVLNNLGSLLAQQNQPELAIIFLKQSVNVTEAIRRDIQGLPQEQQQSYTETVASTYRRLADLLLQQNRILEAQRVLDLLKLQELDDYLHNVRGNEETAQGIETLPPEQQILAEYNQLQNQAIELGKELAQLRQIPESEWTPAQEQRIAELVAKQGQLKRLFVEFTQRPDVVALVNQLNQTAKEQSLQLPRLTNISDNLRNLEQNAVLLYPLILEDRLELVLASPDSPPIRRTVQVTREELNRTIVEFRQALQNPRSDAVTPARQLYDWLIKPLENDLATADAQTIIYAPDAQLRYIPLAALHDGNNWLVQRFRVNNITADSLTDFDKAPQAQLRILAGAFTQGSYSFSVGNEQFTFAGLPFAGKEVEILAEAVPNTTKLIDEEFSKTAILPRMDNHSIVHFATHGALVQGLPDESFILLGNGDRISMREVQNTWFLTNVDLIVLSACETGLGGQFGTGEEILGFGYLMQNAGARAAIASLWQVSDGGTQVLMNAFYAALQEDKITKAEALRQAQIALITDNYETLGEQRSTIAVVRDSLPEAVVNRLSHPYYWAPFILIGNGL